MTKYSIFPLCVNILTIKLLPNFLTGGRFNITCQKDFEELPEDLMDKHVAKNTQFKTWQEMLDFATDKYIISKQK